MTLISSLAASETDSYIDTVVFIVMLAVVAVLTLMIVQKLTAKGETGKGKAYGGNR